MSGIAGIATVLPEEGGVELTTLGDAWSGAHAPADETAALAVDGLVLRDGTPADARRVLVTYESAGEHAFEGLDGPFTAAVFDAPQRRLLLARGKFGERCLYYTYDAERRRLVFSSQLASVLRHAELRPALDPDGLSLYLAFGYVPGPATLFGQVEKLLPGERLTFDAAAAPRRTTYWRLPFVEAGSVGEEECARRVKELFLESLAAHVSGSDEVGVLLSGGVDSTIVVAGLRELGVPRVVTFTIGFDLGDGDGRLRSDVDFARLVAERFGTEHHELVVSSGLTSEGLSYVLEHFDDLVMSPNTYSKYLLARAAAEAGVCCVLTGHGTGSVLDARRRTKVLAALAAGGSIEGGFYRMRARLFDLEEQRRLLRHRPPEQERLLAPLRSCFDDVDPEDPVRRFSLDVFLIVNAEKSLRILDRVGAAAGVEFRAPFLAPSLHEFVAKLPDPEGDDATHLNVKALLTKAFWRVLPREVLDRRVIGYPSYYWNRGELEGLQARLLSRASLAADGLFDYDGVTAVLDDDRRTQRKSAGKRTWALTQFGLWKEIHVNGVRVPS